MVLEQNCAGADLRHLVGDVKIVNRSREEVRSLRIRVNVQVDHAFRHRIRSHLRRRRSGLCQPGDRRTRARGKRPNHHRPT